MITKKDLIGNELLQEIITIRVDTLWKMLAWKKEGRLPKIEEEGAAGDFDNKGALFVPGGLVFEDSDGNPIIKKHQKDLSPKKFRRKVRDSMRYDNATLLFHDRVVSGVNLNNGFFAEVSGRILANKEAATRRKPALGDKPPFKINSRDIAKSYCPTSIKPPYGSRTKLSSCMAACLIEPRMYYIQCRTKLGLRGREQEKDIWNNIRSARRPIVSKDKTVLSPPYVVVCHTTRYWESSLCGITRILGIGRKFGEFATFTLEEVTSDLLNELEEEKKKFDPSDVFAKHAGTRVAGVLRIYHKTTPGKRLVRGANTMLVAPKKDLNINLDKITRSAKAKYKVE